MSCNLGYGSVATGLSLSMVDGFQFAWGVDAPGALVSSTYAPGTGACNVFANGVTCVAVALQTQVGVFMHTLTLSGSVAEVTHTITPPDAYLTTTQYGSTVSTDADHTFVVNAYTSRDSATMGYVASQPVSDPFEVDVGGAHVLTYQLETASNVTLTALIAIGSLSVTAAAAVPSAITAAATSVLAHTIVSSNVAASSILLKYGVSVASASANASDVSDAAFHNAQLKNAVQTLLTFVATTFSSDLEMWVVPATLLLSPATALSAVNLRASKAALAEAEAAATAAGLPGCKFPFVTDATGVDLSTDAELGSGTRLYPTALVGLAAWNYFRATSDLDWLINSGYAVISGAADFLCAYFAPTIAHNASGAAVSASVKNVLDTEDAVTDDHAFTNVAIYLAALAAIDSAHMLGRPVHPSWRTAALLVENLTDVLLHDPAQVSPGGDAWQLAWPLLYGTYAGTPSLLSANLPYYGPSGQTGVLGVVAASVAALRAQVSSASAVEDIAEAHALLTGAMKAANNGADVQDPVLCAAYLLFFQTIYGSLRVQGGMNAVRYVYATYGVFRTFHASTRAVLPPTFGSVTFRCNNSAGSFLVGNSLPMSPVVQDVQFVPGAAVVAFAASSSADVDAYTVHATSPAGTVATATGAASPIVVPGADATYAFSMTSTNASGQRSAASGASVPAAPASAWAVAGPGAAAVYFEAPPRNGGSAVSWYRVSGSTVVLVGAASPVQVAGLTAGVPYAFSVAASNAVGLGPSTAAASVVPYVVPVLSGVEAYNGTALVAFGAPRRATSSGTWSPTAATRGPRSAPSSERPAPSQWRAYASERRTASPWRPPTRRPASGPTARPATPRLSSPPFRTRP